MPSLFKKITTYALTLTLLLNSGVMTGDEQASHLPLPGDSPRDFLGDLPDHLRPEYGAHKARALQATVDYFQALFLTRYGPIRWKQMQWQWDPQAQAQLAKQQLQALEDLRIDSIKPIFNRLMNSTHDGHVSICYSDNRLATLPIKAAWIQSRVIVTRSSLSAIKVGDELISISGMPILDYISRSLYGCDWSGSPLFRPSCDLWRVFARLGLYDALPQDLEGIVKIQARRNGQDIHAFAVWNFVETVSGQDLVDLMQLEKPSAISIHRALYAKHHSPTHQIKKWVEQRLDSLQPGSCAESDLNTCGYATDGKTRSSQGATPVAVNTHDVNLHGGERDYLTGDLSRPHWYIREIGGVKIGYYRLPDFSQDDVITVLDKAIPELMNASQALLIDLRDNGGGYDLICQAVLSRLIDRPLVNVLESSLLDIQLVNQNRETADYYEQLLINTTDDKSLHTIIGDDNLLGYYLSRDVIKDWMLHYRACSEDWQAGHTCTRFVPSGGLRLINPHPGARYTKPIYLLIDERASSCADIFPAILRDNERATLLGRTTAGLGGALKSYEIPNFTGVEEFSLTHSLILRTNQQVIEDLGVEPHFTYEKTLTDVLKPRTEIDRAFDFMAEEIKKQSCL